MYVVIFKDKKLANVYYDKAWKIILSIMCKYQIFLTRTY